MVSIQGASSQNIIFSTPLYMRESFFWIVDFYPYAPAGYFFSKLPGASLKLLNIVFENSLPKRIFWWKKKEFQIFWSAAGFSTVTDYGSLRLLFCLYPVSNTYFWRNMALGEWHVKKIARHNELVVQVLNGRGQPLNLSNANLQNLGG